MRRSVTGTATTLVTAVAAVAAVPSPAASPPASRAWRVHVTAPAQFDLTIARLRYRVPVGADRPRLVVKPVGPTGLNFLAVARPVSQPRGGLVALVVVVNRRPRGSLAPDLQGIDLTTRLSRVVRRPQLSEVVNLYGAAPHEHTTVRALCSVPGSRRLGPGDLRLLTRAGAPPPGFNARATVVQAFQTACGRPVDRRFRAAVQQVQPTPPAPPPPPSPCPCQPRPGISCPDAPPPPCPQPGA
jgi:hypothetical protein